MNKLQSLIAIAISTVISTSAFAGDTYLGVAVGTPGEASMNFGTGKLVDNYDSPIAKKLYGGLSLSDHFGLEAGYLQWGYQFRNPTAGINQVVRLDNNVIYVAAKASMALSERFNLFGKLGVARHYFKFSGNSAETAVRPLLGFGVDYNMTKNIAVTLEFEHTGKVNHGIQRKLETGLKYSF